MSLYPTEQKNCVLKYERNARMRDMRVRSWNASIFRKGEVHYYRNVGKLYFEEEPARPDVFSWRTVLIVILFSGQTGNYIASRTRHAPTQTRSAVFVDKGLKKIPRSITVNIICEKGKNSVLQRIHKYYIKPKLTIVEIF